MSNTLKDILASKGITFEGPINKEDLAAMAEGLKDGILTMPQVFTLEWGDEVAGLLGPEAKAAYEKAVADARKRSPVGTTLAEVLTPDLLSLFTMGLSKAGKLPAILDKVSRLRKAGGVKAPKSRMGALGKGFVKSGTEGAATSAVMQAGEETGPEVNIDLGESLLAGLGSGVLGGLASAPGAVDAARLDTTGAKSNLKRLLGKTTPQDAESMAESIMLDLGNRGFFHKKKGAYDVDSGKFISGEMKVDEAGMPFIAEAPMGGTKDFFTSLTPAKGKDLLNKIKVAKDQIGPKIKEILARETMVQPYLPGVEAPKTKGYFSLDELSGDALLAAKSSDKVQSKITKVQDEIMEVLEDVSKGKDLSIVDLQELKTYFQNKVDWARTANDPGAEIAYKRMARLLKNRVENSVKDAPELKRLMKDYGDLRFVEDSLVPRVLSPEEIELYRGSFAGSPQYAAASFWDSLSGPIRKRTSQVADAMQRSPIVDEATETLKRKSFPAAMSEDGETREQEEAMESLNQYETIEEGEAPVKVDKKMEDLLDQYETVEPSAEYSPTEEEEVDEVLDPTAVNMERRSLMQPQEVMNIPTQLVETKFPRTTEGIAENRDIFRYKFAQEAENIVNSEAQALGMQPGEDEIYETAKQRYDQIAMILEDEEKIHEALPMLIQKYPSFFEKDKYARINNVVPESLRPQVTRDTQLDDNLSNQEKIKKIALLNKTGEYYS
jgi:hypothetical protein